MANPQSAANAYASVQRVSALTPTPVTRPDEEGAANGDFAGMLKQYVGNTADSAARPRPRSRRPSPARATSSTS